MREPVFGAIAAACAINLLNCAAARAEDCTKLKLLSSVEMIHDAEQTAEFVPVTLDGQQKLMLLDTGGAFSEITAQAADTFGLPRARAVWDQYDVAGERSSYFVRSPFQIGSLKADHYEFMVAPDGHTLSNDARFAGIIGPDLLTRFDVDADFGTDKLNLVSPDHCPGKVVYWPASAIAVVPITLTKQGHIIVNVKLDGRDTEALIDTGAFNTTLVQLVAESEFGLKMGAADTPQDGTLEHRANLPIYHHTFKTLEFEGIAVDNPEVKIIPQPTWGLEEETHTPAVGTHIPDRTKDESGVTMLIGMNVLRHFHLYIDYKERTLYITEAGQRAPNIATPAPASAASVTY